MPCWSALRVGRGCGITRATGALSVDASDCENVCWGLQTPQAEAAVKDGSGSGEWSARCSTALARSYAMAATGAGPRRPATAHHGEYMYYEEDNGTVSFVAGLLIGAVIGASVALLTAPQSGRKTRRRLLKAVSTARDSASGRFDDLADDVRSAVDAGRKRVRL